MRLTLNLTHDCNLACTYCFAGEARRSEMSPDIGFAAIERAVDRAAEAGEGLLEISFMGGEPLLAFDLLRSLASRALESARTAGVAVRFQLTTNGTLLDDRRLEFLAGIDADVAISIDGPPEIHDLVRRSRGGAPTGAAVWRALDRALVRLRGVKVVSVVTPQSVGGLPQSIEAMLGRGVRSVVLNPDWTSRWGEPDRSRWRRAYLETAHIYANAYRNNRPFALNQFDDKIDLRIRGAESATYACGSDSDEVAIAPSGRVYGCGRAVAEDSGHVVADCGAEAGRAVPDECSSCVHRFRCASRCECSNRESSGDPGVPGEIICWHERMVIPIADSVAASLFAEGNPAFLWRFYGFDPEVSHALVSSQRI